MLDMDILGQVALGYSAFIDVKRDVSATRLTVFPIKPDSVLDVSELLAAITEVWPPEGGSVLLNVASESLLRDLLLSQPSPNVMLEIPAFAACDPENFAALSALHSNGNILMLKGYPLSPMPPELLRCFKYLISDFSEDQRLLEPGSQQAALRALQRVNEGVRSVADMELSFSRGALAVIGWPIDERVTTEAAGRARAGAQTDLQVVLELIGLVDRQEPIDKIERTLKRDPTLGFKLMKYINSSAFGLKVEIASFRQAIMMLGYQRIKRWLVLLLATATRDPNLKPLMFAAVRRGLLMEELAGGDSEEVRSEVFICGVFSLLDRIFQQPIQSLIKTLTVSERVHETLVEESGPYHPYMEMVRAIEAESLYDFRLAAGNLLLSVEAINRAQMRALAAAAKLE